MSSTQPVGCQAPSRRAFVRGGFSLAAVALPTVLAAGCVGRAQAPRDTGAAATAGRASLEHRAPAIKLRIAGASADRNMLDGVQRLADQGLGWVLRTWPEEMGPKQIDLALPTTDSGATSAAGRALSGEVAATTTGDGLVVLSPHARTMLTDEGVQVVLAHEFTHVMLGQYTDTTSSRWVIEGSAQWTATRFTGRSLSDLAPSVTAAVRRGQFPAGPPKNAEFDNDTALGAVYDAALAWSCFLVARFGQDRFRHFVTAWPATAASFQAEFGASEHALGPSYRSYLAREITTE